MMEECRESAHWMFIISFQITTGFGRTIEVNVGKDPDGTERLYLAHEPPNLRSLVKNGAKVVTFIILPLNSLSASIVVLLSWKARICMGLCIGWDSVASQVKARLLCCVWWCWSWRIPSPRNACNRFGQARGSIFVHPTRAPGDEFGLGGTFWQSIYPTNDINYVSNVIESVMNLFPDMIDPSRLFFMGFSSGGLFSYPLSILLGHR